MDALVVCDTVYGNTALVAEVIDVTLCAHDDVAMRPVGEVDELPPRLALLAVDGPTRPHGLSEPLRASLDGLVPGTHAAG